MSDRQVFVHADVDEHAEADADAGGTIALRTIVPAS